MSGIKDLANPYLAGFSFSRPKPRRHGKDDRSYRTQEPRQENFASTLDWYHHPSKRVNPELRYLQAFDLYSYVQYPLLSLGVLTHQHYLQSTSK